MFCPVGLHYDAEAKTCDLRELIVACGGKKEERCDSCCNYHLYKTIRVCLS